MDINKYIGERIRQLRQNKNINQEELAEYLGVSTQAVSRYELGDRKTDNDILFKLADYFNVSINDFFPSLSIDNTFIVENTHDVSRVTKIPLLGTVKGGNPIEAQENILGYVDIPKEWTKGGKEFYALKIDGNSMSPKYMPNDIVVFEKSDDIYYADGKDCAVMVNGDDVTFKRFNLRGNGITLTPLNLDNEDGYLPTSYDAQEVFDLPIKVIGVARRKISDIEY